MALRFIENKDSNIYEKSELFTAKGALAIRDTRFSKLQTYFF